MTLESGAWIVDTSVVVKWAVRESGSDDALKLVGTELIAPDLLCAELAHALYKKVRDREIGPLQALAAQAQLESMVEFVPSARMSRRALELSLELHHAAGDCFFLATAEALDVRLITADAKLVAKCSQGPYADLVQLLA